MKQRKEKLLKMQRIIMSKTAKELKKEFEADYKVEPDLHVTNDGRVFDNYADHNEAYEKAIGIATKQVGGNHYAKHTIQPWAIIDDWSLDYYLGNVIKYVLRDKNDKIEDLQKAIHYLEKKIELLEQE